MKRLTTLALILVTGNLVPESSWAASLQVSPVLLEITAPGAAAMVTLRNNGKRPIATQVRVFRWSQEAGAERLEPTTDVVASPPAVELRPDQDYVVRVVRTTTRPIEREEAYRLLVDELPEPRQRARAVTFVLRHSIPVLFDTQDGSPPSLVWRVTQTARDVALTVTNQGDRRLRLAEVKISDGTGATVSLGRGLVGYVLGGSTMTFMVPSKPILRQGAKVTVSGRSEDGIFNAPAAVQSAR
jgi:fimbrial chaperone protein